MRPQLLDLFCGAGGCSVGYHRAGFDVVGVDIEAQPRYPFELHRADVLEYLATADLSGFDAIHASPPCHDHSTLAAVTGGDGTGALVLCGSEFGLRTRTERHGEVWLRRHRQFESNVFLLGAGGCNCYGRKNVPVYGNGVAGNRVKLRGPGMAQAAREVMGIDWMRREELDQAIPPAYAAFIGEQLLAQIGAAA